MGANMARRLKDCGYAVTAVYDTHAPSAAALAQDKFSEVSANLLPFVARGEISGAVSLVATKDRVLHLSAVGESDLTSHRKMATSDLFWIASMSKPVTAVAVAGHGTHP